MPAWPTLPPRRIPTWLARFSGFPQHEIQRVIFRFFNFNPGARSQILQPLISQCSVTRKTTDGVIHITAGSRIGESLLNQNLDHGDDIRHGGCGTRLMGRWQDTERG